MKKIYLIIVGAFFILLIIISIILSLGKKSTTNTQKNSPFPTSIPLQESNKQVNQNLSNLSNSSNSSNSPIDISTIAPVETTDFKLQYSSKLNKIVLEKKTPQAEEQFINWATQNQLPQLVENPDLTLIVDLGKNPDDFNPLMEFLNIFLNFGQGISTSTQNQASNLNPPSSTFQPQSELPNQNPSSSFTYYAQCNGFGETALPSGCNLCQAGCGPTTVAMIASSYLGSSYDPKTIVSLYQLNNYYLGCNGSGYSDAKNLLQQLELKTTDYLIYNNETADKVVPDLRNYLAGGWTFFALTRFCNDGCGHFFWITDIDSQDNIFAYDPYYGRFEIPYNENSRYPYPLYRLAFGVKK